MVKTQKIQAQVNKGVIINFNLNVELSFVKIVAIGSKSIEQLSLGYGKSAMIQLRAI